MLSDSPCLASLAEFVRIAVTVWSDGAPLPATCGRRSSNHGEEDFFEYEKQEEQRGGGGTGRQRQVRLTAAARAWG